MIYRIPTRFDGSARYTQTMELDGTVFLLSFDYNTRDQHWYLTLYDSEGALVKGCVGRKLNSRGLVFSGADPARPLGELFVFSPNDTDPGLYSLGVDELLQYYDGSEFGRAADHFNGVEQ